MEVVLDDEDNDEDDEEEDEEDEDDAARLRTYVHTFFALWYHRPDLPAHDIPQSVHSNGALPP